MKLKINFQQTRATSAGDINSLNLLVKPRYFDRHFMLIFIIIFPWLFSYLPFFSSLLSQVICLFCLSFPSLDSDLYNLCFLNFLISQVSFDLRKVNLGLCINFIKATLILCCAFLGHIEIENISNATHKPYYHSPNDSRCSRYTL